MKPDLRLNLGMFIYQFLIFYTALVATDSIIMKHAMSYLSIPLYLYSATLGLFRDFQLQIYND